MNDLLRVYLDPAEIGLDGYPYAWHGKYPTVGVGPRLSYELVNSRDAEEPNSIKDFIRERDGHRCLRCGHPYRKGEHGRGEWSPCDEHCDHGSPVGLIEPEVLRQTREVNGPVIPLAIGQHIHVSSAFATARSRSKSKPYMVIAQWRILTVHHLGEKHDCRWFMLVSLCQRCHLAVQAKVQMNRIWPWEHSNWFKPFAAAWYAWVYEDREITREEAEERMEELLAYERLL